METTVLSTEVLHPVVFLSKACRAPCPHPWFAPCHPLLPELLMVAGAHKRRGMQSEPLYQVKGFFHPIVLAACAAAAVPSWREEMSCQMRTAAVRVWPGWCSAKEGLIALVPSAFPNTTREVQSTSPPPPAAVLHHLCLHIFWITEFLLVSGSITLLSNHCWAMETHWSSRLAPSAVHSDKAALWKL